jgi:hypothetical protein
MPFDRTKAFGHCTVCKSEANIIARDFEVGDVIDCSRCGDFSVGKVHIDDESLPFQDPKRAALASHIIRKMQAPGIRPKLTKEFFEALQTRALPRPAEIMDNFIVLLGEETDGRPGRNIRLDYANPSLLATVGVVAGDDIVWIVNSLYDQRLVHTVVTKTGRPHSLLFEGNLTVSGWQRFEELKRAHISSRFAFFARKFDNAELDEVFEKCATLLNKLDTSFELPPNVPDLWMR